MISQQPTTQTSSQTSLSLNKLVPKEKKIKKTSLLKRKHQIYPLLNSPVIKQLYMVGDMITVNEDSVRNPQNSTQSFIANGLHFSKITSITLNDQFFTMNLKRNQGNFLTQRYMLDRFRSFSDRNLKQFADNVQELLIQSQLVQENILKIQSQIGKQVFWDKLNAKKKKQQEMLEYVLHNYFKDQKYIVLYHINGIKGLGLQKIIISNQMLKETGLKESQLINQYTKQKRLSFQLMGTSAYRDIFVKGSKETANLIRQNRMKNKDILEFDQNQNQISDFSLDLPTQLYRKRYNGQIQWEEKVACQMKFCKPLSSMSMFLFDKVQQKPIAIMNRKAKKIQYMQFDPKQMIQTQMRQARTYQFQVNSKPSQQKQIQV